MALPNLFQQPISETYKGLLHTSNVPIEENTLAVIYDGEGNKSSMKLGKENNGVEFSGKVKATDFSIRDFTTIVDYLYPIGAIYLTANDINPGSRFLGTSWQKVSEGRALVGVGQSQDSSGISKTYQSGNIGGYHEIRLTIDNLPSHTHDGITVSIGNDAAGAIVYSDVTTATNLLRNNAMVKALNAKTLNWFASDRSYNFSTTTVSNLDMTGIAVNSSTGNGIAFDITTPSYGVYIFQRVS